MSEPIPESIPTSTSRLSHRPTKKARSSNPALTAQSHSLAVLFANPDREIPIPAGSTTNPSNSQSALASAPDLVPNVQGSSAGAGSGEFHVYKAARRKEYERLKAMDEEVKLEEETKEWEKKKEELEGKEEKRMGKNRARRAKAKERKANKKRGVSEGVDSEGKDGEGVVVKKGLGARKDLPGVGNGEGGKDNKVEEDVVEGVKNNPDEIGLMIHDDED